MLGFSLPKIIFLLLIIFFVWQFFRIIEKNRKLRDEALKKDDSEDKVYEQLIECSKCGNFYSIDKSKICPICGAKNK